ncbi:hypothetical protein Nmel_013841 [Mimus melanotis]
MYGLAKNKSLCLCSHGKIWGEGGDKVVTRLFLEQAQEGGDKHSRAVLAAPEQRGQNRGRGSICVPQSWQWGLLPCCMCSDTWEQRFVQGRLENPHPWGPVRSSSSQSHSGVPGPLCGITLVVKGGCWESISQSGGSSQSFCGAPCIPQPHCSPWAWLGHGTGHSATLPCPFYALQGALPVFHLPWDGAGWGAGEKCRMGVSVCTGVSFGASWSCWGAWQAGSSAWGSTGSNPRLSQFEKQKMRREKSFSFSFLQLGLKSL